MYRIDARWRAKGYQEKSHTGENATMSYRKRFNEGIQNIFSSHIFGNFTIKNQILKKLIFPGVWGNGRGGGVRTSAYLHTCNNIALNDLF